MSRKIRIFLVEDHPAMLDGLRRLVSRCGEWELCGESRTVAETLELVPRLQPDVLVLDISLRDGTTLGIIPELLKVCHSLRILLFTMHDAPTYVIKAFRLGARGYVEKSCGSAEVLEAIRKMAGWRAHLSGGIAHGLFQRLPEALRHSDKMGLCATGRRIFYLLGESLTNAEIGERIGFTARSVSDWREQIMGRFSISDPVMFSREAVLWTEVMRVKNPGSGI